MKKGRIYAHSAGVWLSDAGADCYDGLRTIDSSISVEDGGRFSCTVNGGILPNHVQLES